MVKLFATKKKEKILDFSSSWYYLCDQKGVPCDGEIFFEDERFSTTLASSLLRAAGKNTKEIRSRVDRDSARIILQTFLDKKNNG